MPEWWTYTLSDFLMFSPRAYYRMLERYNEAVWPAQLVTVGLGLLLLVVARRPTRAGDRMTAAALAGLWVWVAWAFLRQRYATINWPVAYFVQGFTLEALLLIWFGVVRARLGFRRAGDASAVLGLTIFAASLLVYPALASLTGRAWRQSEIFGLAPDPTVLGTLGLLLLVPGRPRWELMTVPVLWCAFSGLTLLALGSAEAAVPAVGALSALAAAGASQLRRLRLEARAHPPGTRSARS